MTAAYGAVAAPVNLAAEDSPVYVNPPAIDQVPSALLSWDLVQTGVQITVQRAADVAGVAGAYGSIFTTATDATGYRDQDPSLTVGDWWYRVLATDVLTGVSSAATPGVQVTLTAITR